MTTLNQTNSLKVERIRQLMLAHQEVVESMAELYSTAEYDHDRIAAAKTDIDKTFSGLFQSYFPSHDQDIDYMNDGVRL